MALDNGKVFPAYDSAIGEIPPRGERLPVDYRPGDLLFFRAFDAMSRCISYRTCTWRQLFCAPFNSGFLPSHVEICADIETNGITRTLSVGSTTFCQQPCFVLGRKIEGVQAHLPAQRVADYRGRIWRLRLKRALDDEESRKLTDFCLQTLGQPYNFVRAAELATFFIRRFHGDPLDDAWFCSDHALTALKAVNRVDQDYDPEDISPGLLAHIVLHSGAVHRISSIGSKSFRVK